MYERPHDRSVVEAGILDETTFHLPWAVKGRAEITVVQPQGNQQHNYRYTTSLSPQVSLRCHSPGINTDTDSSFENLETQEKFFQVRVQETRIPLNAVLKQNLCQICDTEWQLSAMSDCNSLKLKASKKLWSMELNLCGMGTNPHTHRQVVFPSPIQSHIQLISCVSVKG